MRNDWLGSIETEGEYWLDCHVVNHIKRWYDNNHWHRPHDCMGGAHMEDIANHKS